MPVSKNLYVFLFIILGLCCSVTKAQTTKDSIALSQVIIELETNYAYNFSFADQDQR